MSKQKKNKRKNDRWHLPENAADFFDPHYDDDFKANHPILFFLTILAIIVGVMVGPILYILCCSQIQPTVNETLGELLLWIIGFVSSFGISIALLNLFMIVHKQYLGHFVTIISFAVGVIGASIGLFFLWLI